MEQKHTRETDFPRRYVSSLRADQYPTAGASPAGVQAYGAFARDILKAADGDIDFSQYDSDGPDGVPNSGDDDGVVDQIFLVLPSVPPGFILENAEATGIYSLGFGDPYVTGDLGADGRPIAIEASSGTLQRGRDYAEAVGAICHEYGHVLGLSDLRVGRTAVGTTLNRGQFPRVRIGRGFADRHRTSVSLEISADGVVLGQGRIDLVAVPGYRVTGQVRDDEGNPLPGAPVSISQRSAVDASGDAYYLEGATADSSGRYEAFVPAGTYGIQARLPRGAGKGVSTHPLVDVLRLDRGPRRRIVQDGLAARRIRHRDHAMGASRPHPPADHRPRGPGQ